MTNNDLGSENRLSFLKCQARDLILLTRYYICSHENVDLEVLLRIQKEIVEMEPDNAKHFLAIADTCIKLQRYADVGLSDGGPKPSHNLPLKNDRLPEALKNIKKALKMVHKSDSIMLGDLLECYAKVTEVYIKSLTLISVPRHIK